MFGVVGVLSFYRALALGTMSIVAPIVATCAIVPVLAGVLDGERPGALQWVGIVAALVGVDARQPRARRDGGEARKALQLALIAALGIGLTLVFLDRAAEHDALTGVAAAARSSPSRSCSAVVAARSGPRAAGARSRPRGRSACSTPAPTPPSRSPPPAAC